MNAALLTSCGHKWIAGECWHCGKLARDYIEELEAWKNSAMTLLSQYDDIAELVGGKLGSSKADNLEQFVREHLNQ